MKGFWDIHNHILPGIDDGSSCEAESVELLKEAYCQGVSNIVFTPHYRKDMFEIGTEHRLQVFRSIRELYDSSLKDELPGMNFYLGCEFHVHGADMTMLNGEIYRMPGKDIVLAEFSYSDGYDTVARYVENMNKQGLRVIVAHAERYKLNAADVGRLAADNAAVIQINSGSLIGAEGFVISRRGRKLMESGNIKLIGSDTHDMEKRRMNIGRCAQWLEKHYGVAAVEELLIKNPSGLFSGEANE